MSDQQHTPVGGEQDEPQDQQHEQLTLLNMDEIVRRESLMVFARRQLITQEGKADLPAIGDLIFDEIKAAVADTPGDRARVGVTATHLMEKYFPEVPGPSVWADYDPEEALLREKIYDKVKSEVFRVLSTDDDGIVQSRLSANGGMVLSRTKKTKGREQAAYVTRSRKCLDEDIFAPIERKRRQAVDKAAAVTRLLIERLPETDGKWFDRQFRTEGKQIEEAANARVRAALEAAHTDGDDAVTDDE